MTIGLFSGLKFQCNSPVYKLWRAFVFGLLAVLWGLAMGAPAAHGEQVLILYDSSGPYGHTGRTHAAMLENLLGHFKIDIVNKPISAYQAGDMDVASTTFYLGVIYDEPSHYGPENAEQANYNQFLEDASQTSGTLVWFNYNIWLLEDYLQKNGRHLADLFGFTAIGISNVRYNRVSYKGTELYKGVVPHANPGADLTGCVEEGAGRWACSTELNAIEITNANKVEILAKTYSTFQPEAGDTPYITRSGNFWFVGDLPTAHLSEEDRYLALADLLHDMLGIQHEEILRALVRIEDVSAETKADDIGPICDYLQGAGIPFSVSIIPVHVDNAGARQNFSQSSMRQYLAGKVNAASGADISTVAHGYTHQSENPSNPYDGVSGSDFEFYRVTANPDNSLNYIGPLPADVDDWAYHRMQDADKELKLGGFEPFAWSAPHYLASARAYSGIQAVYPIHFGRLTYFIKTDNEPSIYGQFFPYPIHRDAYGYQIVPENIGHYAPNPIAGYRALHPEDMIRHAAKSTVVRDGYASFYYHPKMGAAALKQTVEGIQALGYEFVAPKSIFQSTQPAGEPESRPVDESDGSSGCFLSTP